MRDLIRAYAPKFCIMSRESMKAAAMEKEFCLAAIAGGDTPEEVAARYGIDLAIVEALVREDLAEGHGCCWPPPEM
jgi:hypothetical protein